MVQVATGCRLEAPVRTVPIVSSNRSKDTGEKC